MSDDQKKFYPKATVITLNYNGKHFLEKHYQTLLSQTYPNANFLFVENGSVDGSEEFVRENFPQVKIVKIEKNVGPVMGYNTGGFSVQDSKYLVFIGNDTWLDRDWLKEMIAVAENDENIAICGARQMNYDGTVEMHCGGVGLDVLGYPTVPKDKMSDYFYVDGVSLLIRKDIFQKLGGFDGRYFVFAEEVDLAWRARLLGYTIAIAPKSVFYHALGGTIGKSGLDKKKAGSKEPYIMSVNKRYYAEKNTLCTILKNYSLTPLVIILPLFFLFNLAEAIYFLLTGHVKAALVYPRAWWWNLMNGKETFLRRREVQKSRVVSDKTIVSLMYKGYGKLRSLKIVGMPNVE